MGFLKINKQGLILEELMSEADPSLKTSRTRLRNLGVANF